MIELISLLVIPQRMSRILVGIKLLRAIIRARSRGFVFGALWYWRVERVAMAECRHWIGAFLPRAMSYIRALSSYRSFVMFWLRYG